HRTRWRTQRSGAVVAPGWHGDVPLRAAYRAPGPGHGRSAEHGARRSARLGATTTVGRSDRDLAGLSEDASGAGTGRRLSAPPPRGPGDRRAAARVVGPAGRARVRDRRRSAAPALEGDGAYRSADGPRLHRPRSAAVQRAAGHP